MIKWVNTYLQFKYLNTIAIQEYNRIFYIQYRLGIILHPNK